MKRTIIALALLFMMGCTSYKEAIQGHWELEEIKNGDGDLVYETKGDKRSDVVTLSFETNGGLLTVTAKDADGKEMKAMYHVLEDGRLVSVNRNKPNMYIMEINSNKVVLIDRELNADGRERILVFKKVQ